MANWSGMTRSNYVIPRDLTVFKDYVELFDAECIVQTAQDGTIRCGFVTQAEYGDVPTHTLWGDEDDEQLVADLKAMFGPEYEHVIDDTFDDVDQVSILDYIGYTLAEGQVMTVFSAGHEKARYVTGDAWAIDASGRVEHVSLDGAIEDVIRNKLNIDPAGVADASY